MTADGYWLVRCRDGTDIRLYGVVKAGTTWSEPPRRYLRIIHVRPSRGRTDRWSYDLDLDLVDDWGRVDGPDSDVIVRDDAQRVPDLAAAGQLEGVEQPRAAAADAAVFAPVVETPGQVVLGDLLGRVRDLMVDLEPVGVPDDGTGGDGQVWAAELAARDFSVADGAGRATWAQHTAAAVGRVYAARSDGELLQAQMVVAALMLVWGGVVRRRSTTGGA